jgi:hypothetical protein
MREVWSKDASSVKVVDAGRPVPLALRVAEEASAVHAMTSTEEASLLHNQPSP